MVGYIKRVHFKGEHSCISKVNNIYFDYERYKYSYTSTHFSRTK